VRKMCDKELEPLAAEIDRNNEFPQMRVCGIYNNRHVTNCTVRRSGDS